MWVFVHSTSVGSLFSVTLLPGPPGPQADVASDAGNDVVCDPPHPVSPLLAFLTEYPDLFKEEILDRLEQEDLTVFAQVGKPLMAVVVASGLPRAG